MFEVGGTRVGLLTLSNCSVLHSPSPSRSEQSKLGAAFFVRGKGTVLVESSTVSSEAGFGIWAVQKSAVSLKNTTLTGCGRSSAVAFEKSTLSLEGCRILNGTPHGICARGNATVTVTSTEIAGAEKRAIYTYHSAALSVEDCVITGTLSLTTAAIQCDSLKPGDEGTAVIRGCTFKDNRGGDVSVTGTVRAEVQEEGAEIVVATEFANFAERERD